MSECIKPDLIKELDLYMYVSGVADNEVVNHIEGCSYCTSRSREIAVTLEQSKQLISVIRRFELNMLRVSHLLEVPEMLLRAEASEDVIDHISEIFRAAIVLMHASFEDTLRETMRIHLIDAQADDIDKIPLAGTRTSKFSLGALNKHKESTVTEVIQQSIDDYLDRQSFNSSTQIIGALKQINLDTSQLGEHLDALDKMIARRHEIVHKADLLGELGSEEIVSINAMDIVLWLLNLMQFFFAVVDLVVPIGKKIEEGDEYLLVPTINKLWHLRAKVTQNTVSSAESTMLTFTYLLYRMGLGDVSPKLLAKVVPELEESNLLPEEWKHHFRKNVPQSFFDKYDLGLEEE